MSRAVAAGLACAVLMCLEGGAQEPEKEEIPKQNPYQSESDLARGKRLFGGHCAPCHGPGGEGGKGPSLARPTLPRAPDDPALFRVLRDGIPGTQMPGAWAMIDHELWQVSTYVRSLGRTSPQPVPGDAANGAVLYASKGCAQCHSIGFTGGRMGPPLTEIGDRRSPAYLRRALIDPGAEVPEGFLLLAVQTKDGRSLTGIRLNEDTYSLQIRDLGDNLHSFWKQDLVSWKPAANPSPMPGYRTQFSDRELDDMIAYLVSLRGAK